MFDLKGKVALVTGSAKGIGASIVRAFAQAGADVVINYRSDSSEASAQALASEAVAMGVKALVIQCDVVNFVAVEEMFAQIKETFGKLDIVVNNAGITKDTLLMRMKEADFDTVIDANLKGTFNVTRQAVPAMIKQKGGNIINISSVVGIMGNAGQANYAASKAGIIGLTKATAREVASRNIRVNAVAPGFISSDMTDVLTDAQKEGIQASIPMKRMGTAAEVANVVLFLVSEAAGYMTGQTISVDGGMVM